MKLTEQQCQQLLSLGVEALKIDDYKLHLATGVLSTTVSLTIGVNGNVDELEKRIKDVLGLN